MSSGFPSSQCAGYVGCIPDDLNDFTNDTLRNAYYPSSQEIWFDDINFSFTDNGWRATAGHELGHIFGLDEYYIEGEGPNDVECNPNPPSSVMNALSAPGNVVTGPCSNGSLSPTQRDIDLVEGFYRGAPPIEFNLRLLSPGIMGIDFKDREWAEAGYQFFAYRWTGSTWAGTGEYWVRTFEVGNKDYWNDTTYYKGVSQPDGYYKVCVAVMTEIYWLSGWECSDEYIHMGDHDIEVDYVSAIGPAAVNLSVTQPREMWVLAEMTNQGDYTEEVMFSLEVYLSPPSGCWRSPPGLVLPGSEERYLFSGETSFAVYRILYECHAPATPQYFDQVVSFRADLASGNEPADAKGNNTKAANKTVIVE